MHTHTLTCGFLRWLHGKESTCQCRRHGFEQSWEDPLEKGMATHASILAWEITRIEDPGGLQSRGLQRVRHNWAIEHACTHTLTTVKTWILPFFFLMLGKAWKCDGVDYIAWMSGVRINKCYFKKHIYPICKICLLLILKLMNELMDSVVPEKIMKLFSIQFVAY